MLCVCFLSANVLATPRVPSKRPDFSQLSSEKIIENIAKKAVKKSVKKSPKKTFKKQIIKPKARPEEKSTIFKLPEVFDKIVNVDTDRLSKGDAKIYSNIFKLQSKGNLEQADQEIKRISNPLLLGNVLYQRYIGRYYKTSYKELSSWMKKYADHAGARQIYALAKKKRFGSVGTLYRPKTKRASIGYHYDDIGKPARPYLKEKKHSKVVKKLVRKIKKKISRAPSKALAILEEENSRSILGNTTYDALRGKIAESFYYNNRRDKAYALATVSANRSKKQVPLAGWIAGLSSWKYKKYKNAAKYFEMAATSKRSSSWMISAGAYWASRAHLRNRKPDQVGYWLRKAAEHPRTFYGIIAVKAMGMEQSRFNWGVPELKDKFIDLLIKIPAGKRAIALMDAGNAELAEAELRQINPSKSKILQEAMMALAHKIGAPNFEMRLGGGLKDRDGDLYDSALYPDIPWKPKKGGFYIDKALIHAFMRQESKFKKSVRNRRSGATGLMQLMPRTARNVGRKKGMKITRDNLKDPAVNIFIGQAYLGMLLKDRGVKNNLFKLAVAYNAGPGNLSKWERRMRYETDPLLFIESIPVKETRDFVEKVLTNYWIYRLKYDRTPRTLESVASGEWPIYDRKNIKN